MDGWIAMMVRMRLNAPAPRINFNAVGVRKGEVVTETYTTTYTNVYLYSHMVMERTNPTAEHLTKILPIVCQEEMKKNGEMF